LHSPDVLPATTRWLLDGLVFVVDTAAGMTIRGHFDRVGGSYEVAADGIRIEVAVDATSVDTGNRIWDGLLRSTNGRTLTESPEARFRSTQVRDLGGGRLRVEGHLEAAGKVERMAFDAVVKEVDHGLRLEAAATIDRQRLGRSADRFGIFLPARLHVTMHFSS